MTAAVLVLCAAALLAGVPAAARRMTGRRLTRLRAKPSPPVSSAPPRRPRVRNPRIVVAIASALAVTALVGRWWAVPIGMATGIGVDRFLRSRPPAEVRDAHRRAVADLPLGADLLAAALRAGAPVDRAAGAVADAIGGPLGERLERTARSLRLGGRAAEAWAHLSDVPGAERLIAAAVRSSASGGALAGALTRLADDLRGDRAVAAEAAARRAGVLIVLPLGLCFLPAFLLAGLVPVFVAVLGDVL